MSQVDAAVADAIAIADAYIDARDAYDSERAAALVAEDFRTTEALDGFRNPATMDLVFAVREAYGFRYGPGECEVRSATTEVVTLRCEQGWTTALRGITGCLAVPGRFDLVVRDGRISRIGNDWNADEFGPNVYDPWIDDFLREHPEFRRLAMPSPTSPRNACPSSSSGCRRTSSSTRSGSRPAIRSSE